MSPSEISPSAVGLSEIELAASRYLEAAGGDRDEALRLAIADLLLSEDETAVTAAALDRWTSRGYVRGRATERLGLRFRALES